MFDFPVVIFVEESEDLSEVLRLFLEQLVENVEFSPFDFVILVKVIGFQKNSLELRLLEAFQVLGVGRSFNVTSAFLHHLQDFIEETLPVLGVRNSESSLRSALLPYYLNSLVSFLPSYSGQVLNSFISLRVMMPSSSLSMILRKDLVKF